MKQKPKKEQRTSSHHGEPVTDEFVRDARIELAAPCQRGETKLEFPVGEPDLEALRSVTREWLVPLLVEKFLRERGIELRARPDTGTEKRAISDLAGRSKEVQLDRVLHRQRMKTTTTDPVVEEVGTPSAASNDHARHIAKANE